MCADTITSNYHWVKPEISGSPTTWGVKLNADLDLIDSQLFGTTPIGSITMYAGASAPTGWLLCDGTIYNNTDIPLLAPILANQFGGVSGVSNAMPDLRGIFPIGADAPDGFPVGTNGGEEEHVLTAAEIAAHAHPISDPGHLHNLSNAFGFGVDYPEGTGTTNVFSYGETTDPAVTGITGTNLNTGGDGAHNNMPPYLALNFIIKFQ